MNHAVRSTFFAITLLMSSPGTSNAAIRISPADRDTTVRTIAMYVDDLFYDAESAAVISKSLTDALANGEFNSVADAETLASDLSNRLIGYDRHFHVAYIGPEEVAAIMRGDADDDESTTSDHLAALRRANFGMTRAEVLPGNIGYLQAQRFYQLAQSQDAITAALSLLANTDAMIIDVRQNNGGPPETVQFLISHFLSADKPVLINTFIFRDSEESREMWSLPKHPAGQRPDTPLVILVSSRTASAAEAFAYHLQAMNRATIMGESTAGAGNPGGTYLTDEGFSIFISTEAGRNPITKSNWEGVGVKPDKIAPSSTTLDSAQTFLLQQLQEKGGDANQRRELEWAVESLVALRAPVELGPQQLQRYVANFGARATRLESGSLILTRNGRQPARLRPLGQDRFAFEEDDRYRISIRFDGHHLVEALDILTADGKIESFPVVQDERGH